MKIIPIVATMAQAQVDLKRKKERKKPFHQKKRMLEEVLRDISNIPVPKQQQQSHQQEILMTLPPQQEAVVAMMTTPPPTILTDDGHIADPDISKALMDFDNYVQEVKVIEDSIREDDNVRNQPDYHLRIFNGVSTDPNAVATNELPKIPTTKERVLGILTNPARQVKKAVERREIFMACFLLAKDLNLRTALETLHLSPRTTRLVQLLWHTLSQSFTTFIHHENVVTQFSPRASTCQKKYGIIKEYFDVSENLSAICENVQANLDIIRYIYSNIHAEVYYASDEGLAIERKIKQLLQNNGLQNNSQRRRPPIMNTQPQPVPMVQQQQQRNNMTVGIIFLMALQNASTCTYFTIIRNTIVQNGLVVLFSRLVHSGCKPNSGTFWLPIEER